MTVHLRNAVGPMWGRRRRITAACGSARIKASSAPWSVQADYSDGVQCDGVMAIDQALTFACESIHHTLHNKHRANVSPL